MRRSLLIGICSATGGGAGFGFAEFFDAAIFGDLSLSLTLCTLAGVALGSLGGWTIAALRE